MVGGEGTVLDFSLGGCRVSGQGNVAPGTMLEMRLQLPNEENPLDIGLATVRWAKGPDFGVEFLQLRKEVAERLRQFVAALEAEGAE